MKFLLVRLFCVVLVGMTTVGAVADADPPAQLDPAAEAAAIAHAEATGRQLFRHDRAAWVATDAARSLPGFGQNSSLRGWITVDRPSGGIDVVFFGEHDGGGLAAFYRVAVSKSGKVRGKPLTVDPPEPLQGLELSAAKARMLVGKAQFAPCGDSYNTVVVPVDGSPDRWSAYLMPGTSKPGVVPVGGTFRVDIDLSTNEVKTRPYTKTCLELPNDPRAVGLVVSHLLDPVPTEVHVFWSMWADKTLYVVIPAQGATWAVKGPSVRLVERNGPGS